MPRDWRGVFDAIDAGDWASAQAGIAALPPSVLTPVAKAELYTARNSPAVDVASLQALIAQAPELPEANQLGLMALRRGATTAPMVIPEKPTIVLGSAPVRYRARPVQGEPAADQLRSALDPFVKADDASGAEALLVTQGAALSAEARAEAATRVAFIYYVLGLDMDARRVADTWRPGATGEWGAQAAWVSALASWRLAITTPPPVPSGKWYRCLTNESFAPALIIGRRGRNRPRGGRPPSSPCSRRPQRPKKRPKASMGCSPARRSECRRSSAPTPTAPMTRASRIIPMSSAQSSW